MISVQDCLTFAAEMDRMASRTGDADARRRMQDIAHTWRELAAQMARMSEAESD